MTLSRKAFVLAAGLGERLRPLTDTCPKPLLDIGGVSMIDRVLNSLADFGIEEAIINLHYMPEIFESRLSGRKHPKVTFSHEPELLGRGGGVKNVLSHFDGQAFFILSSDLVWTDNQVPALQRLADAWDPDQMDFLLLLQPMEKSQGYTGLGDYFMAPDGRLTRRLTPERKADYMFTSLRIVHPRVFADAPDGNFDILPMYDEAEQNGRLFGVVHDGEWFHITTPDDYRSIDQIFKDRSAA